MQIEKVLPWHDVKSSSALIGAFIFKSDHFW